MRETARKRTDGASEKSGIPPNSPEGGTVGGTGSKIEKNLLP